MKSEEILETLLTSVSGVHSSTECHRRNCLHNLVLHLAKVIAFRLLSIVFLCYLQSP
jgi:hypothetical protein